MQTLISQIKSSSYKKYFLPLMVFAFLISCADKQINTAPNTAIYFPPISGNTWETVSLQELNWNQNQVQPLLNFLQEKNTKGFIILYNGKIVLENYFNGHTATTPWYWASAGKTLTATMTGIAAEKGLINLNNKVSDYLGNGWTSAPLAKENLITSKHLLSMNSGLDDSLGDNVLPSNLQYKADVGTRWAYHNVYVKLQDIIEKTSKQSFSNYFDTHLKDKIGMSGLWIQNGDFSIYWSNTRSMARFGLLAMNKGKWDKTAIVNEIYFNNSVNTSQNINKAYGYLWWLNGKTSYLLPQSQLEFQGKLIPSAPDDLYAALGKNDQKIYVVPSKKLVIVRMGDSADGTNFALSSFDELLWQRINLIVN